MTVGKIALWGVGALAFVAFGLPIVLWLVTGWGNFLLRHPL